jgi:hypothetical protein
MQTPFEVYTVWTYDNHDGEYLNCFYIPYMVGLCTSVSVIKRSRKFNPLYFPAKLILYTVIRQIWSDI